MPTCLVTGGAGFIGSHLTDLLVSEGFHVRVLDNFSNGKRENLAHLPNDSVTIIEGDIRDEDTVRAACDGVDYVSHQAALGSVPRSVKDPALVHDVNVRGTLNVLIAARDAKVKRLVFASSSSIYGGASAKPVSEDATPFPRSPYAVTKITGEYYCRVWNDLFGLETVLLRYFNVFGPRQRADSPYAAVIPLFIDACIRNEQAEIHGTGEQQRSFTYVTNVAHANRNALRLPVVGETYNVGGMKTVSIATLHTMLKTITNSDKEPRFGPKREGDVMISAPDLSHAKKTLLPDEIVSLEDGLARTVAWHTESRV